MEYDRNGLLLKLGYVNPVTCLPASEFFNRHGVLHTGYSIKNIDEEPDISTHKMVKEEIDALKKIGFITSEDVELSKFYMQRLGLRDLGSAICEMHRDGNKGLYTQLEKDNISTREMVGEEIDALVRTGLITPEDAELSGIYMQELDLDDLGSAIFNMHTNRNNGNNELHTYLKDLYE